MGVEYMWRVLTIGIVVLSLLVTGITMAQEATPEATETPEPTLIGVTWQWEEFADGQQAFEVPTPYYTITFDDEGGFVARSDCNTALGSFTADAGAISILPGPMTLALCPPESLSNDFIRYLGQVAIYSFTEDGRLLLEAPADSGSMAFSAQPQVTGTVSYRERIALPDDAVIRVQIQDVSIVDAPTITIGEQVIVTGGAQVPIAFAVSYPASIIDETKIYSLSARITDGVGNLLFINDTYVPVITQDNPTSDIELVLVRVGS